MTELEPTELEPAGLPVTAAVEALLMVADQPVGEVELATAIGVPVAAVTAAIDHLTREYAEAGHGFELRRVAGGWRYYTHPAAAGVVERYTREEQQSRLTQAALETLAVVAYRQPVSRSRISAVRGVSVDAVMRTLVARGLVAEVGHDQESGAVLYGTTDYFLERMGLGGLDELPDLAPYLPDRSGLEATLAELDLPEGQV
jgi:segregation and condensation protein B